MGSRLTPQEEASMETQQQADIPQSDQNHNLDVPGAAADAQQPATEQFVNTGMCLGLKLQAAVLISPWRLSHLS